MSNSLKAIWGALVLAALFSAKAFSQNIVVYEPWETVALEHADRVNRLKRIAGRLGTSQPEFFEYVIPEEKHQLPDFPVDLPVLRVVYPEEVFFGTDSSSLTNEALRVIDNVAASLWKEPADVTVFIVGHTDSRGSERYNLDLGERRAQSVAQDLAYRRVPQSQIYRVSFGEFAPVTSNETPNGRARNRRVEFLFAARPEPIAVWLLEEQKNILEEYEGTSLRSTKPNPSSSNEVDSLKDGSVTHGGQKEASAEDATNETGVRKSEAVEVDRTTKEAIEPKSDISEQSFEQDVQDITIEAESIEVKLDEAEKTVLDIGRKKVVLNLTQKKSKLVTQ